MEKYHIFMIVNCQGNYSKTFSEYAAIIRMRQLMSLHTVNIE